MVLLLFLVGIMELAAGLTVLAGGVFLASWLVVLHAPPGVPIFTPIVEWGTVYVERMHTGYEPHWIVLGIVMVGLLAEILLANIRLVIASALK